VIVHIYIIVFSILIVGIIRYFKVLNKFKNILTTIKKITHIIISKKISDSWKEKVILKYSLLLFLSSFQILIILILIVIIYFIFNFINTSFSNHLISTIGIIETSVIVLIYLYLKKPIKGNYSFLQKQLHYLVLGNQMIKKSLFKIEEMLFANQLTDVKNHQHIFITGLPRSGTTILLEFLYKTNKFASLTYNDMPFILSPNLFLKFNRRQNFQLKERMHKDNIQFNLQSPEAFDDVFFQTFNKDEIQKNLKTFISLVLKKYDKKFYLSKNNNNYKRIKLIQSIFPLAKFIVPFRNPLQHANSLLFQHRHFCKLQKQEKFILQYMNYLGHFEFGLNHRHWNLPKNFSDEFSLNYWLEQWLLFYEAILDKFSKFSFITFISYEQICNNKNFQSKLMQRLNLNLNFNFEYKFSLSQKKITENYDEKLFNKCNLIEEKLLSLSIN
jgi:hypothetical protein